MNRPARADRLSICGALRRVRKMQAFYPRRNSEEQVTDMLTDLRHFCDSQGLDFEALSERGDLHYSAELQGLG